MREFAFYDRLSRLQLAHPGLLSFMGSYQRTIQGGPQNATQDKTAALPKDKRYCIVTEVASLGTLSQVLFEKKSPSTNGGKQEGKISFLDKLQIAI